MEEGVAKVVFVMLTTGFLTGALFMFVCEEFVKFLWRK